MRSVRFQGPDCLDNSGRTAHREMGLPSWSRGEWWPAALRPTVRGQLAALSRGLSGGLGWWLPCQPLRIRGPGWPAALSAPVLCRLPGSCGGSWSPLSELLPSLLRGPCGHIPHVSHNHHSWGCSTLNPRHVLDSSEHAFVRATPGLGAWPCAGLRLRPQVPAWRPGPQGPCARCSAHRPLRSSQRACKVGGTILKVRKLGSGCVAFPKPQSQGWTQVWLPCWGLLASPPLSSPAQRARCRWTGACASLVAPCSPVCARGHLSSA